MKRATVGITTFLAMLMIGGLAPWAAAAEPEVPSVKPVDESMHHFMEYFYEPAYKRLKLQLAEQPADRAGWNAVKGDALTLAEGGNLLLLRAPAEEKAAWSRMSAEVRELAGKVYQAARAQNYTQARGDYQALISRCNACHQKFAEGEHQLEP
ncbi:MAG: hypothetical protein J5I93_26485 [Pirellulaceae bacterium]|nr:hypothetical protein [Pirellulaceae bacterium]